MNDTQRAILETLREDLEKRAWYLKKIKRIKHSPDSFEKALGLNLLKEMGVDPLILDDEELDLCDTGSLCFVREIIIVDRSNADNRITITQTAYLDKGKVVISQEPSRYFDPDDEDSLLCFNQEDESKLKEFFKVANEKDA